MLNSFQVRQTRPRPSRWGSALLLSLLAGCLAALPARQALSQAPPPAGEGAAALQVGQPLPDFHLAAVDGTLHGPEELRGRKNLVLIFFRGTW
ncbi:MAG: hypothetical protein ACE5HD_11080 [Acidobacteriota bacterium]